MCGIVGFIGKKEALPVLMEGLGRLEYRGYDSAGVALLDESLSIHKSTGRLSNLEKKLQGQSTKGNRGIGHTRWATHGPPSERNCHPHTGTNAKIAIVHNGIIENYLELKSALIKEGHEFSSDTDTEVLAHVIEAERKKTKNLKEALLAALNKARGAYALGVISEDEPDVIYAARQGSPLIIGIGPDGYYIASDVPAIKEAQQVIYLKDGEIAELRPDGVSLYTLDGKEAAATVQEITILCEDADRAGFETFMLKEIHEQPRVLRQLINKHLNGTQPEFDPGFIQGVERIMIISCGTAYYAGMYGKMIVEAMTGIPCEIDLGSEFRYRNPLLNDKMLIIAVSQSGETADTLASIKLAKENGCKIMSLCNVPGSSLTRESDYVFYTDAGPEIGVASTKAYTAQLMSFAIIALKMAQELGRIDNIDQEVAELKAIPDDIHYVLSRSDVIREIADKHHDGPSALYLGRRYNYPTALEGALKNKEISYQHAEGYAAGEMKHGPIALISEYMPVVCICTKTADEVYEKIISNIREVEARHGRIIAIATDGDEGIKDIAEDIIFVPETKEEYSPMINVVALQLLAYYAAQARGTDIDKPRNLAKSVTVE